MDNQTNQNKFNDNELDIFPIVPTMGDFILSWVDIGNKIAEVIFPENFSEHAKKSEKPNA